MPGSENLTKILFHYVYVLESIKCGKLYIGYTTNLRDRFKSHNLGLNFSTKPYRPWHLTHFEVYLNEEDAKRREKYLKTSQGSRLLKRMLKEYFYSKKKLNNFNK
jgi:putative endonuclease